MDKSIKELYGNRVRLRVGGLCWENNQLLLINHRGLYPHDFWAPPGGGLEFGELAPIALKREFLEETGLEIEVGDFAFACELIRLPLHAVELFFEVRVIGGRLALGGDPEMPPGRQLIQDVRYLSEEECLRLPKNELHGLFGLAKSNENIRRLKGYFKI